MRFFHLLSDGKTVREISEREYWRLSRQRQDRKEFRLLTYSKHGISAVKGKHAVFVPMRQLNEVKRIEEEKTE